MLEMEDIKKIIGDLFLRIYQLEKQLEAEKKKNAEPPKEQ